MDKEIRLNVQRTVTNSIERWGLYIVSFVIASFISTSALHHSSWMQILAFLAVLAGTHLLLAFVYQYGIPTQLACDDSGIVFKGNRYNFDQVNTVAITPKLNFRIILTAGEPLRVKPYHHARIQKDEIQAWCHKHGIAFRHMGHSKAWWSD